MKTKEDILISYGKAYEYHHSTQVCPIKAAHDAMDEYAKQQAIAFAMHVLGKLKKDRSSWVAQENDDYIMAVSATVDHHYDKFIESQNK